MDTDPRLELTEREKRLLARDDRFIQRAGWGVTAGAACLVIAAGLIGFEVLQWMKTGAWPSLTWADGLAWLNLPVPQVQWVGLDRVIRWVLASPLWGFFFLLFWLVTWVTFGRAEHAGLSLARQKRSRAKAGQSGFGM